MKKLILAAIISLSSVSTAAFAEIKVGIILGFTGPIESLTPAMRDGAKLAFLEASNSGDLLDGETFAINIQDSTCVDAAAATAAAESMVGDGVVVFEFYEFVKVVKFDFSLSEEHLFVDAQFFVRDAVSPLLDHFVGGLDALFEQLW